MQPRRLVGTGCAAAAASLLAACGSTATPKTTPTPVAQTPTPAPVADNQTVSVVTTGVGAWQLVAIPVAVLHNNAARHGAAAVVVHFTTHGAGGQTLGSLDSQAVNLAPGATVPVAADCTDGCNDATQTDVTVSVGNWTTSTGPSVTTAAGAYQCNTGACGGGHAQGTVSGTLTASHVAADTSIVAFAVCTDGGGGVVGAGVTQTVWRGGATGAVHVPVIVNSAPAGCQLGASAGW